MELTYLVRLLQEARLFHGLETGDLATVARAAQIREVNCERFFFAAEARAGTVYPLLHGCVKMTQATAEGTKVLERFVKKGGSSPMSHDTTTVAATTGFWEDLDRSPLQPEIILPQQFFAELRRPATGERLLVIAILEDAINCFQKFHFATGARNRRLFREAEEWIMEPGTRSQDDNSHPYFSFEQICDALRLDPDYIRLGLQRWRERQLASSRRPAFRWAGRPPQATRPGAKRPGRASGSALRVAS